ncbi:MAG: hypothetical protein ABI472_06415 [Ginsengibacter sp.]
MGKIALCFIAVMGCCTAEAQVPVCADMHNGIFYFYPKNTKDQFEEIMDKKYLREKNFLTGDTAVWSVRWKGDCAFESAYISGNTIHNKKTQQFLDNHEIYYKIERVTPGYFVFSGYTDDADGKLIQQDTMWRSEKITSAHTGLFEKMNDTSQIRKSKFNNVSPYALLYIFRPKKFTNSLSGFPVFIDNSFLCTAKNGIGYVYKILKEGDLTLRSGLLKDTTSLLMHIQFGKRYYVRSAINWGITKRLYNFTLALDELPVEKGSVEFENIELN